jgi:glycosidase
MKGSSGWRLDVGGELDPGQGVDPLNRYWEEFRTAIKATSPSAVIIGEEWGNASSWLTGWEWDSVMNYRFRDAVLGWLTDGCQGLGCTSGLIFQDNNNRVGRANGPLYPLRDSQFDLKLKGIQENYPPQSWYAMLNLLGSHDTNRVLFMLKKLSHDDETLALRKLALASLFQFTYPGAPTVFYGDEAGVKAEARWYDDTWFSDPYSRAVYPWADEGLTPHLGLLTHYQRLGEMRANHPALTRGQYQTDYVDDQRRIFAFRRFTSSEEAFVILNRSERPNRCQFRLPSRLDGAVMNDVLNGESFRVQGGTIDCGQIEGLWGRVLIPQTGGSSVH